MRKKIILLGVEFLLCLLIFGCCHENSQSELDSWEVVFEKSDTYIDEESLDIFDEAKQNYNALNLDVIALLGKQIVAGENYMFLAKGYNDLDEDNATYKIVIIYNDLENNSTITNVVDFDYTKYVNENIENSYELLQGGWYVDIPEAKVILSREIQIAFDNATSTLTGATYTPIAVLGKQIVSGTNYAILCYGKASYNDSTGAIYLITLYL